MLISADLLALLGESLSADGNKPCIQGLAFSRPHVVYSVLLQENFSPDKMSVARVIGKTGQYNRVMS